jgi:carbonic anhydrase/acetyltransferase-like protein (isoleucine patch superfamily)
VSIALPTIPVSAFCSPHVDDAAFVAHNAMVIGDVNIASDASVWFGCVLRGDVQGIDVGARSNLQDGVVVHASTGGPRTVIGAEVTVGHAAVLHGCLLEDGAFVGIGAIVLDRAVVGKGGILAAGAVLTPGKIVGQGELWAGNPAKFLRLLSDAEREGICANASRYVELAHHYRRSQPYIFTKEHSK